MGKSITRSLNVVCLATFFKGVPIFIRELKSPTAATHVVVVLKEKMLDEEWPRRRHRRSVCPCPIRCLACGDRTIDVIRHIYANAEGSGRVVALEGVRRYPGRADSRASFACPA